MLKTKIKLQLAELKFEKLKQEQFDDICEAICAKVSQKQAASCALLSNRRALLEVVEKEEEIQKQARLLESGSE